MFGLFGKKHDFKTYTPTELQDLLRAEGDALRLVDVREDSEWAGGHIPGATLAPLSRFDQVAANLPKDKALVFYCQGGVRSKRALGMARDFGLTAQGHLGGGFVGWRNAGLPMEA
jgi:rhodanese-related sulfurtransferase